MLKAAITFFVIGIIAFVLGASNIGGYSIEIGKTFLIVFVIMAIISLLASLFTGKTTK